MSGQARVGKGTGATEEKQKRKSFGISPKDYNIPGQRPLDRNNILFQSEYVDRQQLVSRQGSYIIGWLRCQTQYIDPSNSIGVRPRIASGRLVWPTRLGQ